MPLLGLFVGVSVNHFDQSQLEQSVQIFRGFATRHFFAFWLRHLSNGMALCEDPPALIAHLLTLWVGLASRHSRLLEVH
jgi:hypothetical protein